MGATVFIRGDLKHAGRHGNETGQERGDVKFSVTCGGGPRGRGMLIVSGGVLERDAGSGGIKGGVHLQRQRQRSGHVGSGHARPQVHEVFTIRLHGTIEAIELRVLGADLGAP